MHIHALHIDGFGIFNDFELSGFDQGINLVVGANEAGKSTLLQFFRYTLFGYPRSVDERMAPLRGGNHGGRIIAQLQDGKKVTFERMSGASGGNIRLVYPNRESSSQNEWNQLLGQASPQMYENIYAFTLDELVGFDKLRESGIRDRLFSVQLGLGEVSLNDVAATLTNASEAIYKSRGSVQLVPKLKNDLDEKRQQLQALQAKKGEYEQLQKEVAEMSDAIAAREKEAKELRQKIDKREKLLQCYDNYYELMEVREQLQEAPEAQGLDEKLRTEMEALVRDQKNVKAEIENLQQKQKRKKEELQSTTVDAEILEKEPSIKWLETNLEKYRSTVDALRKLESQLKDEQKNIQQELRDIGGEWTEEKVRAFEGYEQKTDQAARFQQQFDNLKERKLRLEAQLANRQPATIDTKKVLFALAALALVAGIGSLVSGLFALGIILVGSAIGLGGYAHWGLKKPNDQTQDGSEWARLEKEQEQLENEYNQFLKSLHLAPSIQTATAKELLRRINALQSRLLQLDRQQEELANLQAYKQEFEKVLQSLNADTAHPAGAVEALVQQLNDEKAKQRQFEALQAQLKEWDEELADQKLAEKQANEAIGQLLEKLGVETVDDFYRTIDKDLQVQQWQRQEAEQIKQLERIAGRGKAEEVVTYWEQNEKVQLESKLDQMKEHLQQLDNDLKAQYDQRGKKGNALAELEEVASLSEVLTEIHALKNQLRDAYKEWLTNQVALQMLEKEKKRFEKEKQPEVIRLSEQHFARITKGRYPRIQMPLGGEDVVIYDAQERPKRTHELSRGTREQLLISLRMGFIEEYEKTAEPLPVVMDEILVNFDPARTRETTEILADFANDRQLLFFTCHPSTEQFFEGLDYNLIKLDGGNKEGSTLFG